ncbi:MAG: hypothetical protein AABY45_03190, partial [Deltaproteobacteria bacterium]
MVYFYLNKCRLVLASKSWLVICSLFFYSWWNVRYLPLMLGSITFNYAVGTFLQKIKTRNSRYILIFGISVNIVLLGYFKYADFFIANVNLLAGASLPPQHIILPLGISFFTFTQISHIQPRSATKGVATSIG